MINNLIPTIGLMSGTSMDGIDCSLVYTNGIDLEKTEYNSCTPYTKKTLLLLEEAVLDPLLFLKNKLKLIKLTKLITEEHSLVIKKLIHNSSIQPKLIGFHGQTIHHNPRNKTSIQIGDGKFLGKLFKTNIVFNFRENDLLHGGEGAPLAPIYHKHILIKLNLKLPSCVVNIGGISNISYWDGSLLHGFDTGPGNNLMDKFMKLRFGKPFDLNGNISSYGSVKHELVNEFCNSVYYKIKKPKSLDINQLITNDLWNKIYELNSYDAMATLCFITAKTIAKGTKCFFNPPKNILIFGGGQKNITLIKMIKSLTKISIFTGDDFNIDSNFVEAELIAFLSARRNFNLPITFPTTTGVEYPISGGILYKYSNLY